MRDSKNFLFWLLVIPASFIIGILCLVPFRLVLYFTFEKGSMIEGMDTEPIERFLTPLVLSFCSVMAARIFVQTDKYQASMRVFMVYSFLWLWGNVLALLNTTLFGVQLHFKWETVVGIVGAVLAIYLSRRKDSL